MTMHHSYLTHYASCLNGFNVDLTVRTFTGHTSLTWGIDTAPFS